MVEKPESIRREILEWPWYPHYPTPFPIPYPLPGGGGDPPPPILLSKDRLARIKVQELDMQIKQLEMQIDRLNLMKEMLVDEYKIG